MPGESNHDPMAPGRRKPPAAQCHSILGLERHRFPSNVDLKGREGELVAPSTAWWAVQRMNGVGSQSESSGYQCAAEGKHHAKGAPESGHVHVNAVPGMHENTPHAGFRRCDRTEAMFHPH